MYPKIIRSIILISLPLLILSCSTQPKLADQPEGVQALSFFDEPLYSPAPSERALTSFDNAKTAYENNPDDPELLIAYGRSAVALGNYRQSIDIFTIGVQKHPDNPVMYRRRGHRYISTRQIPLAIKDLSKAAKLIQADPPADQNLISDIYYHLGLAHYLDADFEKALEAYQQDYQIANDDPSLAAISNWIYMTLRRLGRDDQAAAILEPIHSDMQPGPNAVYHKLLLFYKGELTLGQLENDPSGGSENAAILYGIANYHFYNGQTEWAIRGFQDILKTDGFAAFGYIAAEADLDRMKLPDDIDILAVKIILDQHVNANKEDITSFVIYPDKVTATDTPELLDENKWRIGPWQITVREHMIHARYMDPVFPKTNAPVRICIPEVFVYIGCQNDFYYVMGSETRLSMISFNPKK